MKSSLRAGLLAVALSAALPALAQGGPPPAGATAQRQMMRGPDGPPFAGMSEPGRRAVMDAMHPGGPADRADHDRVRAARDRMLQVLSADRLDTAALRHAMDDEREAANAMKVRRSAALVQVLQGLSAGDRRAFVADARAMRGRFEGRMAMMKRHTRGRGGRDDGPPPPPPM